MPIRKLGARIAAALIAVGAATLVASPVLGYQEVGCRKACMVGQVAAIKRCRSNCSMTLEGARFYCYHLCIGRGR